MAHELMVKRLVADELAVLTPAFLTKMGWELNSLAYPHIDVTVLGSRPFRVRMNYENWPDQAPSAELLEVSNQVLKVETFAMFNMGSHPATGRPFVCMRGFHEYHTHPSHLDVSWEAVQQETGNNLIGLLTQLSRAWRKTYPL